MNSLVLALCLCLFQAQAPEASKVKLPDSIRVSAHTAHTRHGDEGGGIRSGSGSGGELGVGVVHALEAVRDRGVEWLMSRRTEEYGWGSDETARVVVALASAVEDWPAKNDLVARLIVKQLEIELLEKLLRKEIEPLTPAKVAFFALAVEAACSKDPHDFFGHNLVASLDKHHNDQDFPGYPETFGYSFTSLVSCLAGSHLHRKRTRHLLDIANENPSRQFSIDTRGSALIALECIQHRKKGEILGNHMHEPMKAMGEGQQEDGSFGNIHTTAIAIQALAASTDFHLSWNKTKAALALASFQEPNGSFLNNVYATTESVVAASALLNGLGLLKLRRGHCTIPRKKGANKAASTINNNYVTDEFLHHQIQEEQDSTISSLNLTTNNFKEHTTSPHNNTIPPQQQGNKFLVSVSYWLWIGEGTPTTHNLTIIVPANTSFFNVMQRAAEMSTEYEFSSAIWPNGHYIHTISGQHEQPVAYHYWLLYELKGDPDPVNPPSPSSVASAGVDDLQVQDGQVYLFWFKRI